MCFNNSLKDNIPDDPTNQPIRPVRSNTSTTDRHSKTTASMPTTHASTDTMAYTSGTGPVNAGVAGSGADNQYTEEERRQISEQRRLQLQEESGGPSGPGLGFHGYGGTGGVM